MYHIVPSTIQPSTYFFTSHWPSNESKFFLDIGSWPLCLYTCVDRNTLWIPCSNFLDKWSNCDGSFLCAMCIEPSKNTSSMDQNGFHPIELRTYCTCLSPTRSHFQGQVVLKLWLPQVDDLAVYQRVCEHMNLLRHVLFLIPHGISKEKSPSHLKSGRY